MILSSSHAFAFFLAFFVNLHFVTAGKKARFKQVKVKQVKVKHDPDVDLQIGETPEPMQLPVSPIWGLARPLRVALPCCGIDGCGRALEQLQVPFSACNVYDLQSGYLSYLTQHFSELGMTGSVPNLGQLAGDLLRIPIPKLDVPVDILCAGPPCPPWAGQGCRRSTADPRAQVFFKIMMWVIFFIKCGGLLACVLENVLGIIQNAGGREPVGQHFLQALRFACPEFSWRIEVLRACKYLLPQTRVRVFIIGLRKKVKSQLQGVYRAATTMK